ncbi:Sprr2h: Small proline-rich protein 2H [Crotalus adamanteus]|uniref:Sprr2h: Small proline-rich protein 2H n=1 Tax=Crotalus adamanteus TaxID=8729 RepID=A0AAW1ANB7_CROAD
MSFPYQQCKQPCLPPPVCGKGSSTQCKVCVPACPSPSVPVCVSPGVKVIGEPCIPVCPPPCVPKCTGPAVDSICVKPQGVCPCDCKCPDPCSSHNSSALTSSCIRFWGALFQSFQMFKHL